MKLLHTRIRSRLLDPIRARIDELGLPVELAALGSGPGDALFAGESLSTEQFALAQDAGVRWVQMLTVGLEETLSPDVTDSPVVVTTVGGVAVGPIAEFALARMLEHAKDLPGLADLQARHAWEMPFLERLESKTLTVLGLGPIGERVAELGRALRMHVIGVRRRPQVGSESCHEVVGPDDLVDVLPRTDYLVIAAPQTPATEGLVGRAALDALKDGAFLVNVGRGRLVDEDALLGAVRQGRLRAALDVVREEPLPPDSPLWSTPGLAVSPHCASLTPALFDDLAGIAVDNLARFLRGDELRNVADKAAGYPVRAQPSATA